MIVGAWQWLQYEDAFAKGLKKYGVEVIPFSTSHFFNGLLGHYQLKLPLRGPALSQLNQCLTNEITIKSPDSVLFWRPTHILPGTLKKIQNLGISTISYNNDDPFSQRASAKFPWHYHWLWSHYLKCLPYFDFNFFYRSVNCDEARAYGARHTELLMPYFLPWQDQPVTLTKTEYEQFATDVVFVGHYEPDGREYSIYKLIKSGIQVKIWSGSNWGRALPQEYYKKNGSIYPALGDNYTKALCGAKICLAFLSKLNRDTYTRRCFEIPACGQLMLAERTDDLRRLFQEDKEACFFSSDEELLSKVQWLLDNPKIRHQIAWAGQKRVWADGHDVYSRVKEFLNVIHKKQKDGC